MSSCSSCHRVFTCAMRDRADPSPEPGHACWCASLPPLESIDPAAGCLCPECLAARLATQASRASQAFEVSEASEALMMSKASKAPEPAEVPR